MKMFETTNDPKSPAFASSEYNEQVGSWVKIQTVLDGTEAMRGAGRSYMPQHWEESDGAYEERLSRNTLYNKTEITLDIWAGRPFEELLQEDENEPPPAQILEITDNIDLAGTDVDVFARRWFKDGVAKGFSHVLVEYPRREEVEGRARTLADDRAEAVRPYWVHIRPEHLFFAEAVMVDGRELLNEIRMFEVYQEREMFGTIEKPQIRRMFLMMDEAGNRRVGVEIYHPVEKAKKEEDKWRIFDSYVMEIDEIPLVTFYADRDAFMTAKPPLEDLVDLNIAHWQSTSDQRAVVTVARFPMLALSGGTDENQELTIGPHEWLWSPDPQGKFYYVEHSGKAIEAGRKDLEDLENQMSAYGAMFMQKKPGNPTATARALDSAEMTSPLQDAAFRFNDAMSVALYLTARWMGLDDGGKMLAQTDFEPMSFESGDTKILLEARKNRDLSNRTFLTELKRRTILDEGVDVDDEMTALEEETMAMSAAAGIPIDPLTGQPMEEDDDEEETEEEGSEENDET